MSYNNVICKKWQNIFNIFFLRDFFYSRCIMFHILHNTAFFNLYGRFEIVSLVLLCACPLHVWYKFTIYINYLLIIFILIQASELLSYVLHDNIPMMCHMCQNISCRVLLFIFLNGILHISGNHKFCSVFFQV